MSIDEMVIETVSECLSHNGISPEVISKIISEIEYAGRELYSYAGLSVADSNFHANEKKQQEDRIKKIHEEHQRSEKKMKEEYEESLRNSRYAIARRNERIQELEAQQLNLRK